MTMAELPEHARYVSQSSAGGDIPQDYPDNCFVLQPMIQWKSFQEASMMPGASYAMTHKTLSRVSVAGLRRDTGWVAFVPFFTCKEVPYWTIQGQEPYTVHFLCPWSANNANLLTFKAMPAEITVRLISLIMHTGHASLKRLSKAFQAKQQ